MTRAYEIDVTQDDIDQGERLDADFCPVAIALQRVLPEGIHCAVSAAQIALHTESGSYFTHWTEATLAHWIEGFDDGRPVAPFRARLRLDTDWFEWAAAHDPGACEDEDCQCRHWDVYTDGPDLDGRGSHMWGDY